MSPFICPSFSMVAQDAVNKNKDTTTNDNDFGNDDILLSDKNDSWVGGAAVPFPWHRESGRCWCEWKERGSLTMKVLAGGGEGKNLCTTASFSFKFLHTKKIGDPSRVARRERAEGKKIPIQPLYFSVVGGREGGPRGSSWPHNMPSIWLIILLFSQHHIHYHTWPSWFVMILTPLLLCYDLGYTKRI